MGATGWVYLVPYQPDMERLLDDQRRDVLARYGPYERWLESYATVGI